MPVTIDRTEAVATVTVDNPPVNALDDPTLAGLGDAARELAGDDRVRAVVLTGTGKTFMAGADLGALAHALATPGEMREHVALTRPTFDAWEALAAPVVAAVNGHAVGGGLEVALLADFLVAEPRARFGVPEVTLGLIPGGGGTQRLARRIGSGAALELALLGELVDAERARALGIVNIVAEPGATLAAAQALAERLAALPAVAVQAAKRLIRGAADRALADGLDAERDAFLAVAATEDARAGVAAFLDKRPATFVHR